MTSIEDIKELIASTAEIARQNSEAIRGLQASRAEANKRWAEGQERWAEGQERWAEGQKRWDEGLIELKRQREEMRDMREEARDAREEARNAHEEFREELLASRKEFREELLASRKESDRIWTGLYAELRGLRRDVGQLGNKLGIYTEAIFFPSLERILRQDFGMQVVEPRVHVEAPDGDKIEIDVLAHANDTIDLVFDVEIKTHLRQDGLDQILDHLHRLSKFFPEHRGKKAYGILGALEIPAEMKAKALQAGIYVASIRDDVFELLRPEGFEPRAFPI